MEIIKHKSITATPEEIMAMIEGKMPKGDIAINITDGNTVIVEPLDCCNLMGIYDEDYETIYYEE